MYFCLFVLSPFQYLGTTVAETVFACCHFCPKKSFIEEIIKLEKTMDMVELIDSILRYTDEEGNTSLLILFELALGYKIQTGKFPDSAMPMMIEIESSAFFLLKLAEDNNLNMDHILNRTADNGMTLFRKAASFSETLASALLKKNVVVTTVDYMFQIPVFRVS